MGKILDRRSYSGPKSAGFWKRINALPEAWQCGLYSLGCVLQKIEYDVLERLENQNARPGDPEAPPWIWGEDDDDPVFRRVMGLKYTGRRSAWFWRLARDPVTLALGERLRDVEWYALDALDDAEQAVKEEKERGNERRLGAPVEKAPVPAHGRGGRGARTRQGHGAVEKVRKKDGAPHKT